jgi:hypothetical protein
MKQQVTWHSNSGRNLDAAWCIFWKRDDSDVAMTTQGW